ncbi:hypothetical protein [Aureibaculum luteum]|uniref:hypothetical protein n=1 Tax=Aureibaculum luteum TaxID=1548456 RepID=UPI0013009EA0|nr:hypothetical protein [Aureibaculum luteum]
MSKIEIFGLIIITVGLLSIYLFDNDGIDFISGLLIGLGLGLSFSRLIKSKKIN